MAIPKEYEGREQSYLKHLVLEQYLNAWAQKLGSLSRQRSTRLVYVDCFAGPWESQAQDRSDTSVHVGLEALDRALSTWGAPLSARAIFVEKDAKAFQRLGAFLNTRSRRIATLALPGEFGDHVERIGQEIGRDAAFLFVDPTGWKGAAMRFIAPLARPQRRDVLINVMFNHVNRFKDDTREFLREQMREFFGLTENDIPPKLTEDELMAFYCEQLRSTCSLPFVANLAVPSPLKNRTWFHLVVGGHNSAVLDLFRTVERRVCGALAAGVRAEAKAAATGQSSLLFDEHDVSYDERHRQSLVRVREFFAAGVRNSSTRFLTVWTDLLQRNHVTRQDVAAIAREFERGGRLVIESKRPKALDDDDVVRWR